VTPAEDEDVIQALSSNRADPALGERVRPWGPDRRLEDSDVLGPEDLVEAPGELRVPIPEQDVLVPEGSGDREVPGLLGHPGRVRSAGGAGHVDPSGRELDEEQDVERLQEHRLDREEVACDDSSALCSQELAPGRTGSTRRGPEAGATQDPPDGARSDPDPQLAEFALDSHASPSGVLPAETDDEIGRLGIEGRPTGASPMVGPLPPYEFAVPAEEGLGRDHERGPTVPAERPTRRGEERPVSVFELRAARRTAKHPYLVTKGSVFELELRHAPLSGEHSDQADEHEVAEGSQGAGMLPASVKGAEPNFGPPQDESEFWHPSG